MAKPNPDKLKVLWQKGRNYFASFFVELGDVRNTIGDDRSFASWCVTDLHIGLDALTTVSKVLKRADADIVRRDLAAAHEADRTQRRLKKAEERKLRDEERARAALEKAQKKEAAKRERKQKRDKEYRKRKKEELLALYAAGAKTNGKALALDTEELFDQLKQALSRLVASRAEWAAASVDMAQFLCLLRAKFPNDNDFGTELERRKIHLNKNDRAALLNLGLNLEVMRKILNETHRSSYQLIWKDVQLRLGKD